MIYLEYDKTSILPDRRIEFIHYIPFDPEHGFGKSKEELERSGILVDSIPTSSEKPNMIATLMVKIETKELWYEYTETPLPDDDRIARLEKENTDLRKSNLDTQEAILELYEMLMGTPTT
ncbi:hypothetical protein BRE01_50580 [Brevibacillus reuszeri]|uniref:Uncharacterized protein n=1 Tax=Brevibacillus reuszeri TaxID=54915 RepID=A0A0K9YLW1_9BACL|nr:hypothetical protein [Brevibacillus reuszeri]KNB69642.1 hypothetical protein ADS79_27700 [Brevibacillus reuszeri]MED1855978.1 hypothetical protein [Brevibacillus reuszeri]GED71356.1 hypothetical protein BRE01_50580 [Brevibacillus reuszeri]